MRPTLTLKKRPAAPAPSDAVVEPSLVDAAVLQPAPMPAENPPKVSKAAKPSAQAVKAARAEANRLLNEEQQARRAAQLLTMAPIVQAYLNDQPVMRDTVVDGVECLRPLVIGVHKTFLAQLLSLPEAQGCSNTVITDLIKAVMEAHVRKSQYMHGLLKFPHRFDLEGNPADVIGDELRRRIQTRLHKLSQKKAKHQPEADSATS